ncbi:MAG TPA: molybdate ABC transporter permease subunit [Thermoanaerobaculia bacterium]|nr:molybdate ABC transporter permease subunit [Thermoanaerobaculia bacterium]
MLFTVRVAAASTLLGAPFALLLATISWRSRSPRRALLDAIALLPLVLPPTAVGFILLELLSRRRWIGALLENLGVEILFTPAAAILASAVMAFPLMFTAFRVALEATNRRLFDVARTLGATSVGAYLRVTMPLALPGIAAGLLLGFCRALGEFGATILIAGSIPGRTQTLALAIYERVQSGREEEAVPLVLVVVTLAAFAVAISEMLTLRQRRNAR